MMKEFSVIILSCMVWFAYSCETGKNWDGLEDDFGNAEDFECNNHTIIRSVLKTSVRDEIPENSSGLYYKVVAVDNRWNESEQATILLKLNSKLAL